MSALLASAAIADVARFLPWQGANPPLTLRDLTGSPRTLADFRGKVVIVNFWATWCEPCREEMPSMQKLQDRFPGRVAVVAVNYGESVTKAGDFMKQLPVAFTVLLDANQEAARAWRVRLLPASFVVDADGQVRHTVIGEMDWSSDAAVKAVAALVR